MSHTKRLDKATSILFLGGFFFSKLQNTPLLLLSVLFNLISLSLYLTGYILWYIASHLYPNYPQKEECWYGFTQFKNQYKISAMLGTAAILLCLLAIPFPLLMLPASLLFAVSNTIWCIAEYHKMKQPPSYDKDYSSEKQSVYMRYALLSTGISILTVTAAILSLCFPPVALPLMITTTIISFLLNLIAIDTWLACQLETYKPDRAISSSGIMLEQLEARPDLQRAPDSDLSIEQTNPEMFTLLTPKRQKEWINAPQHPVNSDGIPFSSPLSTSFR
ncbi:hypothetical protein [Legionella spiritensis]|uniref:CD20-like family protein n=1 Tax=Legionella spiritensis TaxID=452 RepID=A0A0W0Z4D5_LEGSP|nr:hypothetical protein [Legionella spiritensis]KTD63989.1 CD20-like family protein [Legionella spiritensis]SNV37022.1 CD20-like family [Legionella spiritensis]